MIQRQQHDPSFALKSCPKNRKRSLGIFDDTNIPTQFKFEEISPIKDRKMQLIMVLNLDPQMLDNINKYMVLTLSGIGTLRYGVNTTWKQRMLSNVKSSLLVLLIYSRGMRELSMRGSPDVSSHISLFTNMGLRKFANATKKV